MTVRVELEHTICYECGLQYAVPGSLLRYREHDNRPVYCPNGHRNRYGSAKPDAALVEKRRRKLLLVHNREQAEARAVDAMKKS